MHLKASVVVEWSNKLFNVVHSTFADREDGGLNLDEGEFFRVPFNSKQIRNTRGIILHQILHLVTDFRARGPITAFDNSSSKPSGWLIHIKIRKEGGQLRYILSLKGSGRPIGLSHPQVVSATYLEWKIVSNKSMQVKMSALYSKNNNVYH